MKVVALYDTALCNLNCNYCFISKNSTISDVDKELESCFLDQDYFANLLQLYFSLEEIKDISRLEIWGGEPLLKLERIFSFIKKLVNLSPNFNEIFFSSNFAHNNVIPAIKNLYTFLMNEYPLRSFKISIQISCDGPEDITDANRGIGTTKKIIQNFDYLLQEDIFDNKFIKFYFSIKPTLDMISLKKLLDFDYNIFYYKFFEENFLEKLDKKDLFKQNPITPIPNLASPTNHTQEDGFVLRDVLKVQRKIEQQHKITPIFKYYNNITLYTPRITEQNRTSVGQTDFQSPSGFCGSGTNVIGLLPNNKVCGCHRSFAEYYKNYNQNYSTGLHSKNALHVPDDYVNINHLIFSSPEEWKTYSELMNSYAIQNSKFSTTFIYSNANELMLLAKCGLVDEKYTNLMEAIKAIRQIMICNGICVANNLLFTGTTTCYGNPELKLFCNGALDEIFMEDR